MRRRLLVPITRCSREYRRRQWAVVKSDPPPFRSTMVRTAGLAAGLVAILLAMVAWL